MLVAGTVPLVSVKPWHSTLLMSVVLPKGEMLSLLSLQGGKPLSPKHTLTSPRMTWMACALRLGEFNGEDCTSTSTEGTVRAERTRPGAGAAVARARMEVNAAMRVEVYILSIGVGWLVGCEEK